MKYLPFIENKKKKSNSINIDIPESCDMYYTELKDCINQVKNKIIDKSACLVLSKNLIHCINTNYIKL